MLRGDQYKKVKSLESDRIQRGFYLALLRLLEDQDYSEIQVTQIAEEAGRDRTTFYRYFENKEDLLARSFSHYLRISFHELGTLESWTTEAVFFKIRKTFNLLEKHLRTLKILLGPHSPDFIKDIFNVSINEFCREILPSSLHGLLDFDKVNFISQILSHCFQGVVSFCLNSRDLYDRELMEKCFYIILEQRDLNLLQNKEEDLSLLFNPVPSDLLNVYEQQKM